MTSERFRRSPRRQPRRDVPETVRKTAERAIARLTGPTFRVRKSGRPCRSLADAAWRLHRHQVDLGERTRCCSGLGTKSEMFLRLARSRRRRPRRSSAFVSRTMPCGFRPVIVQRRVVHLSLTLEKAIEKVWLNVISVRGSSHTCCRKSCGCVAFDRRAQDGDRRRQV